MFFNQNNQNNNNNNNNSNDPYMTSSSYNYITGTGGQGKVIV